MTNTFRQEIGDEMTKLRMALLANGVFSVLAGMAMAVFAEGLGDQMTIPAPMLTVIGIGVAVFGGITSWIASRPVVAHGPVLAVIVADLLWVVSALAVLAVPSSMSAKWILAAVTVIVGGFAFLQIRALVAESQERPRLLTTEVRIDASPQEVWDQLVDLGSYRDWNPFMVTAAGTVSAGEVLVVEMQPPEKRAMSFKPTLIEVTPAARLHWLGSLVTPGLFDGRHRFELEATGTGTRLVHSEEFSGLLVPVLWASLDTSTRAGFEAMNLALKQRVEMAQAI